jgi:hypothetical protein
MQPVVSALIAKLVMPGLVRGIHVLTKVAEIKAWLAGTSPAMTKSGERLGMTTTHNGAALSPRALDSFVASEATTMTTAIRAITSVQMALISGFTPSRTSE